jgi:hypothetical protein
MSDGDETGIDCGGATCTRRCPVGTACATNADCATGRCDANSGLCRSETAAEVCSNGVQDTQETAVDCGGQLCRTAGVVCSDGQACLVDADCSSGALCYAPDAADADDTVSIALDALSAGPTTMLGICFSCTNGVKDGDESDVDCGGRFCDRCPEATPARLCVDASDCQSGRCVGGQCVSCSNNRVDGDEIGVDCGGSCPNKCQIGKTCVSSTDCSSGLCVAESATIPLTVSCSVAGTYVIDSGNTVCKPACVLPAGAPTGYNIASPTAMACSQLFNPVICEVPAVCAGGYSVASGGAVVHFCDYTTNNVLQLTGCTNTDACDGVDCGTGAKCVDSAPPSTSYTCECDTGYYGSTTTGSAASCTPNTCTSLPTTTTGYDITTNAIACSNKITGNRIYCV